MESIPKAGSFFTDILERVKEKAIAEGHWGKNPKEVPEFKEKKKRKTKKHKDKRRFENFPKLYPEIFNTAGLILLYYYLWKWGKKTKKGNLRWEGYIRAVAQDLGRSYRQTRRDFKTLEKFKVLHRWNTGKKFPGNIIKGEGTFYHKTVVTIAWNPADFKRQRIIEKKEKAKRKGEKTTCLKSLKNP